MPFPDTLARVYPPRTSSPIGSSSTQKAWSSTSRPRPCSWAADTTVPRGGGPYACHALIGSTRTMRPRHVIMAVGVSEEYQTFPILKAPTISRGSFCIPAGKRRPRCEGQARPDSVSAPVATTSLRICTSEAPTSQCCSALPITVVLLEPSSVRAYEMYRQNEGIRPPRRYRLHHLGRTVRSATPASWAAQQADGGGGQRAA